MPKFYTKKLNCGCKILAFQTGVKNDKVILDGHNYNYVCELCKFNLSQEDLEDRLEHVCDNDYEICVYNMNNWIQIKREK